MQKAVEIIEFLKFSSKLKSQERSIKTLWERQESVADHSWHLCLMTLLVFPHLEKKVDLLKILKMALVHDLVEAEVGDVDYGAARKSPELKRKKEEKERKEIAKIKEMIGGSLGEEVYDLWYEFEETETDEAKLVKALDSLEANHQSILVDINYWDDCYYEFALNKAKKHCKHENILVKLNEEITNRMKVEFERIGLDVERLDKGD